MRINRAAALATAGIVGAGVIGGATYAAVSTPAAASSDLGTVADGALAAAQPGPGAGVGAGMKQMRLGRRGLLNRLEHGQLTIRTNNGDRTIDLQRGTVVGTPSTSISVKSLDGVTGSYTVAGAKIRGKSGPESISAVHAGDTVFVIASGGKALRILDRGTTAGG